MAGVVVFPLRAMQRKETPLEQVFIRAAGAGGGGWLLIGFRQDSLGGVDYQSVRAEVGVWKRLIEI